MTICSDVQISLLLTRAIKLNILLFLVVVEWPKFLFAALPAHIMSFANCRNYPWSEPADESEQVVELDLQRCKMTAINRQIDRNLVDSKRRASCCEIVLNVSCKHIVIVTVCKLILMQSLLHHSPCHVHWLRLCWYFIGLLHGFH